MIEDFYQKAIKDVFDNTQEEDEETERDRRRPKQS